MGRCDSLDLIFNVAELARLFEKSGSLSGFLHEVVSTVAEHMHTPVASVYLYEDESKELLLTANVGLELKKDEEVRLKLGEGITGLAVKELRPICESVGADNPSYKHIPNIREEEYQAFLAVPILRGFNRVGGLVVQHTRKDYFREEDIKALSAIASQLASTIENARLLISVSKGSHRARLQPEAGCPDFVKGTPGSAGFALGKATVISGGGSDYLEVLVSKGESMYLNMDHFKGSLHKSEQQIRELEEHLEEKMLDVSAAMIFSAHQLMLKDAEFTGRISRYIENGMSPPRAVQKVVNEFIVQFSSMENTLLQEKTQDVLDLGHRILENLVDEATEAEDYVGRVVIADELLPSGMLKLAAQGVAGVLLLRGSVTAHVSILARSLDIPLVIVNEKRFLNLTENAEVLIDGGLGNVFLNPGKEVCKRYASIEKAEKEAEKAEITPVTQTADGTVVHLLANINLCGDLFVAKKFHAEGVGLYRSEFPFIIRKEFPSEEEQNRIYRRVIEEMDGYEVTFRTLDIGGDKMLSYFPTMDEANPFMGLRAIRFSLRHQDIFCQQLRALLTAGEGHVLKVMFPMVSSVDDFVQAREILMNCRQQLIDKEVISEKACEIQVGAMIEVPSAVAVIDELADEADFLSIGSNDLVQYLLAVDRTNKHIENLYIPHHPAVLRALKTIVESADRKNKAISICGVMASDIRLLSFLIGIGLRRFSFDARKMPAIQKAISSIDVSEAVKIASDLLSMSRITEIEDYMETLTPGLKTQI